MGKVSIEIDEVSRDNPLMKKKIRVYFDFDQDLVNKVKQIAGAKFDRSMGASWTVPLDLDTCQQLRRQFGDLLKISPELATWYKQENKHVKILTSLSSADDADLKILPTVLPDLYDFIKTRPYQKADIAFMARNPSPCNFNQPGTGKTVEVIGAVYEAGPDMSDGPQLVVAPISSLETVWQYELERWQGYPVLVAKQDPRQRIELLMEAVEMYEEGMPFWLVINPAMVRYKRIMPNKRNQLEFPIEIPIYPELFEIQWKHKIIDEFHKCGLGNTATITHQAMMDLRAEKAIPISGTPIGGKVIKLYGVLHFANPKVFSSKWQFADRWLEVSDAIGRDGRSYGKRIDNLRKDREEDFSKMLTQYAVRRTKAEVAPQLPPKQFIDVWANLDDNDEQRRQYREFEALAIVAIADDEISATSILAEYTRLKQFADSVQDITRRKVKDEEVINLKPVVGQSVKLPHVERIIQELGIDPKDPDGDEQIVICSQFSSMIDMVTEYLGKAGYPVAKFTGATKAEDRARLVKAFQDKAHPLRILCMTTTAGGVSITLDNASTMIVLDETWVPDDQEQVADRLHRVSKIHQVVIYTIRTRSTIEEYVYQTNIDKQNIKDLALDIRLRLLDRAAGSGDAS